MKFNFKFNDKILICDEATNDFVPLTVKYQSELLGIEVNTAIDNTKTKFKNVNIDFVFSVYLPLIKKTFHFLARNRIEKENWTKLFKSVEQANKYETGIDRSNIGFKEPKWIPDEFCLHCCKCKSEFTTMIRRHHCR